MKKFFLFVVLALSAMAAQGQCTWNVRGGLGLQSGNSRYYGDFDGWNENEGVVAGGAIAIQCNIPIGKSHRHTFSPTVFSTLGELSSGLGLLQYGYKIGSGIKGIFYPKIGAAVGGGSDVGGIFGGSIELAYEYKHLIMALNYIPAYTAEAECCFHAFGLTFGYKF